MSASARAELARTEASPINALSPGQQEKLSRLLESYLADLERGGIPDTEQLIADNSELANALKHSIDGLQFLHKATAAFGVGQTATPQELPYRELGDFRIKREVGRGGMGVVYEAEQVSIGRKVALKVLPFAAVLDQKQIARFNNEAQAAGQLNHPHIVPIYSVGCERGVHYYSMQLIDGQSLDLAIHELRVWAGEIDLDEVAPGLASTASIPARVSRQRERSTHPPISPAAETRSVGSFSTARSVKSRDHIQMVAELGAQAADALHHAHEHGIIHRDVKPSNLLIDLQSKLWITDFGLARCQAGNNITMTGDLLGTARYMSPEQAAGRGELVDHRTDIYSLGITLYELLTLRQAFTGSDRPELMRQIEHDEPLAPRHLNPVIPHDLETILLKSTAKSRDDRYESAQLFADDLRRFMAGEPTLARRPTFVDRVAKWAVRHRKLVATVFVVIVLALLGISVAAFLIAREQSKTAGALRTAEANLTLASENFRQSRMAVDELGSMVINQLASVPGMEGLRRELLQKTLRHYEQFVKKLQGNSDLKFDMAFSYSKIGELQGQLGKLKEAIRAYEEARRLYRRLRSDQPEVERFRQDLALCSNNMGHLLEQQGKTDLARSAYANAASDFRGIVERNPSEPRYQQALALALTNIGSLQRRVGELDEAQTTYREAVSLQEQLFAEDGDNAELCSQLAGSYNELSFLLGGADAETAVGYNSKALTALQRLAELDPDSWKRSAQLAACYNNRGAIFKHNGSLEDARAAYEAGIVIQERLARQAPDIVQLQHELGVSHNNLGQLLAESSPADAEQRFRRAEAIFAKLISTATDSPRYRASLGGVLNNLGLIFEKSQRLDDASTAYEQAITHQESAYRQAPQVVEFRLLLSTAYVNYGRVLCEQGMPESAGGVAIRRRSLWSGDGQRLYNVAGELARAAVKAAELDRQDGEACQQLVDAAVATLSEAIEAGFRDDEPLSEDERFRALLGSDRLKRLQAELAGRPSERP